MGSLPRLGAPEVRSGQGRGKLRAGAVERGNNCSPQDPLRRSDGEYRGKYILGEGLLQGVRGCRRNTQRRGQVHP